MNISEILSNQIKPFEIEDQKLLKLFSFFLHSAPTISSDTAMQISNERLDRNWNDFISKIDQSNYTIISNNCSIEKYLENYNFLPNSSVNRFSKGFICKRKDKTKPIMNVY